MSKYTLSQLAELLKAEYRGDPDAEVTSLATLSAAQPGQISFLDNPRYRKDLMHTKASIVILSPRNVEYCPCNALVMENPYLGYAKVSLLFDNAPTALPGVHPSAVVAEDAEVDPTAAIGANVVVESGAKIAAGANIAANCVIGEDAEIGANTRLWANVTVYHQCVIGERCIIHSGVVVGSDGFGMAKDNDSWHKIAQLGRVVIGNDVEIGANTTLDRGALGDTEIADGVKLDNQIQVAHNVKIGSNTAVAGCTGISGSTEIGSNCAIGGAVCIGGHITIADNVVITGMSGVSKTITEPGIYSSGIPLQTNRAWRRSVAWFRQLDEMANRIRELEKTVNEETVE